MKIYIDSECHCHISNPDNAFREFDVPFFDGKCTTFIEGYRYCPQDESYIRDDGKVVKGECIVPWKPYSALDAAQREYERMMAEAEAAYREGVNSVD